MPLKGHLILSRASVVTPRSAPSAKPLDAHTFYPSHPVRYSTGTCTEPAIG